MNIFKWFNAGSDAAAKVLDGAVRGLDALVYTDEEKAEMRKKLGDQWVEVNKILTEETTVRSVTRRIMAVSIVFPFVGLITAAAIAWPFNQEYSKFLLGLADGNFGFMALGVAAFYFGPYMMGYMKK